MSEKMRKDDFEVLKGIQKNTQMAMTAISTINDKIYDDTLAVQLAADSMRYAKIHTKATERILRQQREGYQESGINKMMLVGGIHANTMMNTSTSHMAELLIQGNNRGLTDMWKTMNQNENAGNMSVELAKELMDFEEKAIEQLKKYL